MPNLNHFSSSNRNFVYQLSAVLIICVLLIPFISNWSFISSAYSQERVYTYTSEITVLKNRSLDITETITVVVENIKIRHGIYRDFDTSRVNQDNKKVEVKFKILGVTRNGVREQFHTRQQGEKIRVFFGSKTKLVAKGIQTYIIHYVTTNQLNSYPDKDEFYWNASGNKWSMPIFRVEATVILPSKVKRNKITYSAYSGYNGVNKQNYISSFLNNHTIKFALNRKYNSGNGLTIALDWPAGFIDPANPDKRSLITQIEKNKKKDTPAATLESFKKLFVKPEIIAEEKPVVSIVEIKKEPQEEPVINTIKTADTQIKNKPIALKTVDDISKFRILFDNISNINITNLIGLIGLVILLFYFTIIRLYLNNNKSNQSNASTPNDKRIPENLSPASIRYIYEMGYDDRTFAIALINIAVKGHIDIINTGSSYKIERRDFSAAEPLSNDEALLFKTLMNNENDIQLTSKNHKVIRDAMTKHQNLLENDHKNKYFSTNSKLFNYALALIVITSVAIAFIEINPVEIITSFILISLFTFSTFIISYLILDMFNFYNTFKIKFLLNSKLYNAIQESKEAYLFAMIAIEISFVLFLLNYIDLLNIVTIFAASVIYSIFSEKLVSPNSEGKNLLNKIVNLKEFITHGEMLQANVAHDSIQISEQISAFDNYLPYTIALGVESEWGDHYSLLFDHKKESEDEILGYSPHWYHGSGWEENNTTDFCESLSSKFSLSAASAAKSPEYNYRTKLNSIKH